MHFWNVSYNLCLEKKNSCLQKKKMYVRERNYICFIVVIIHIYLRTTQEIEFSFVLDFPIFLT